MLITYCPAGSHFPLEDSPDKQRHRDTPDLPPKSPVEPEVAQPTPGAGGGADATSEGLELLELKAWANMPWLLFTTC